MRFGETGKGGVSALSAFSRVWTNSDGFAHTATSQDAAAPFDTGKLETGQAASYRFEAPGTFAYKCAIHNSMTGTIVVK